MDQDQGAKFMRGGKKAVQARVGELGSADLRADLDTEEARLAHALAHLVDGPVGVLQCDGAERSEASWMLVGDAGEELVLRRGQVGSAGGRRPVAERHRNRGKDLHPNAFVVHIDEPSRCRPAPVIDPAVVLPAEQQTRFGLAGAVDAGPVVVRIRTSQIRQIIVDGVGVDIDEACAGRQLSVDGGGSAQHVRRQCPTEDSYYGCTIQDVYA
jgi:hypothetical protein